MPSAHAWWSCDMHNYKLVNHSHKSQSKERSKNLSCDDLESKILLNIIRPIIRSNLSDPGFSSLTVSHLSHRFSQLRLGD